MGSGAKVGGHGSGKLRAGLEPAVPAEKAERIGAADRRAGRRRVQVADKLNSFVASIDFSDAAAMIDELQARRRATC
jgi:hypothetical protein